MPTYLDSHKAHQSLRDRIALAAAVCGIACAIVAVSLRQPSYQTVSGVCRDSSTGAILTGVTVTLSRNGSDDDTQQNGAGDDDSDTIDTAGDITAPVTWAQGSASDTDVDAAGADTTPRSEWEVTSDSGGRFVVKGVPNGSYDIYATSSGHSSAGPVPVPVVAGQNCRIDLALTADQPTLSFEPETRNWTPAEDAVLPMTGLLPNRQVTLTISRIDVSATLATDPNEIASPNDDSDDSDEPDAQKSKPAIHYSVLRRWDYVIPDADREGSFYDRIRLDRLPLGLYRIGAVAHVAGSDVSASTWLRVTDLAIIDKRYQGGLLAYVTNIVTGKPAANVGLMLYDTDNNATKLLARAATSAQGVARLNTEKAGQESDGDLIAYDGSSTAAITFPLNSRDVEDDTADQAPADSSASLRSYVYTDRPLYRPGQTVYVKGILRWYGRKAGFTIPVDKPVDVAIRDSNDTLIDHCTVTTDDMGSWNTKVALSTEALTGDYTVTETIGGQSAIGSFGVAAYKKPEFQVTVTFSKDRYVRGDTIVATVDAAYYYGAPVAGAKTDITAFTGDDSDSDDSSGDSTSGEPAFDKEVTLDSDGKAVVDIPTGARSALGEQNTSDDLDTGGADQSYTVQATVDDASGSSIDSSASVTVAQGLFSLSLTPSCENCAPGQPVTVAIQAAGPSGGGIPNVPIKVSAAYDEWIDGQDRTTPLLTSNLQTSAMGAAGLAVPDPRAGLLQITASTRDSRGNAISSQTEIWITSDDADLSVRMPDLAIVLDRAKYAPGQTARLLINSSHPGPSALITVEGDTLYNSMIVPLAHRCTEIDLPVTAEDAASVTVTASLVFAKGFLSSSQTLTINDTGHALNVIVQPDHPSYHPGDPATIRVLTLDASGRPAPAQVSLAVVDSSIFAIAPAPDTTIADALQPAQEDQVDTSDSCADQYLGDVDKASTDIQIRRRFPDTALWLPDVHTGADGSAVVHMEMPDTLTSWRVTCIGQTAGTAVGQATAEMVVSKDFLVRLEPPTFLTAGDSGTIIAEVSNNTAAPLTAHVVLAATGLGIDNAGSRDIAVLPGVSSRLTWNVTAPLSVQPNAQAQVQITARAGSLSDGMEEAVPVLMHGAQMDRWDSGTLLDRESCDIVTDPHALGSTTVLHVRLSPTVGAGLATAADYLDTFPYSSTDVTAADLIAASSLLSVSPDPAAVSDLRDRATRAVLRLERNQSTSGGWGWFSTDQADAEMTAIATIALSSAKKAGVTVDPNYTQSAAEQLDSLNGSERQAAITNHSYAQMALAYADDDRPTEALNAIALLRHEWLGAPAQMYPRDVAETALAAHDLGPAQEALAQSLMSQLWAVCRTTGSMTSWSAYGHRNSVAADSDEPDSEATAWALLAAETITPNDARIDGAARCLMTTRFGDHWESPVATAIAIDALSEYAAKSHEDQPDFTARIIVNGTLVRQVRFDPASIHNPDFTLDIPGTALAAGSNVVTFEKVGPGRLYYSLDLSQCIAQNPVPPPSVWAAVADRIIHPRGVPLPPAPSGYRIKRVYLRMTARRNFLVEDTVPAPDTAMNAGEDMLVRLIIQSTRPAARVMINEPVPAGCRIAEASGDEMSDWAHWWDYTDVRDSKIVFFVQDLTPGEHEIDYHLAAQTSGAYDVMPTMLTSTVDPTLHALGRAARITIDGN